jgi:hypothetical protein
MKKIPQINIWSADTPEKRRAILDAQESALENYLSKKKTEDFSKKLKKDIKSGKAIPNYGYKKNYA